MAALSAFAPAVAGTPVPAEWDAASVRALAAAPDAVQTIQALILQDLPGADAGASVCSYAFVDFAGRGTYRLVASVDLSGRDFCNRVAVIGRAAGRDRVQTFAAWRADSVADLIVADGKAGHALAVPTALSNYESGPDCVAAWPVIYALRGTELAEAGRDHPDVYRQLLSEKTRDLASAGADMPCRVMEIDKLKRVLGIAPDAGLATARAWMASPDPALRAKAARIFADIGGSAAALKTLATDRNPAVADTARAALR